jgi:hypothetical protein
MDHRLLSLGIVMLLFVQGCGTGDEADRPDAIEQNAAIQHLRARSEGASRVRWFDTLADLLPNVTWRADAPALAPQVEAVVVGRIEQTTYGRAFTSGEPQSVEVAWDDAAADWRTLHLRVRVEEAIGSEPDVGTAVDVGLAIGTQDPDAVLHALEQLGRVLLPLMGPGAVFDYDHDRFSIAMDGELLGTVSDSGAISLPVLDPEEERRFLAGTPTVAQLQLAAAGPEREIRLGPSGQRLDPRPADPVATSG